MIPVRAPWIGKGDDVKWLRLVLIEQWAMLLLALVVGFLGPFGTYLDADFPHRAANWWVHLMGAYVLVRPTIMLWSAVADATGLPRRGLVLSGVLVSSVPLTLVWVWGAGVFFHALGGFFGLLPFALLSAIAVLGLTWSARDIDSRLRHAPDASGKAVSSERQDAELEASEPGADEARLYGRLSASFVRPIVALQSEDHYVRVHGRRGSELLLMRLRDAIAEMDGCCGEQVHRSWWVARGGFETVEADGRNRALKLLNGEKALVARDSVTRLERIGFLEAQGEGA